MQHSSRSTAATKVWCKTIFFFLIGFDLFLGYFLWNLFKGTHGLLPLTFRIIYAIILPGLFAATFLEYFRAGSNNKATFRAFANMLLQHIEETTGFFLVCSIILALIGMFFVYMFICWKNVEFVCDQYVEVYQEFCRHNFKVGDLDPGRPGIFRLRVGHHSFIYKDPTQHDFSYADFRVVFFSDVSPQTIKLKSPSPDHVKLK